MGLKFIWWQRRLKVIFLKLLRNPPEAVQFRISVTLDHLKSYISGKRVVELGCGTGRLSQKIIKLGASSYSGYDIAENAVNIAREQNNGDLITFERADIGELTLIEADVVFSVGLISQITLQQIDRMFDISKKIDFYHTISEPQFTSFRSALRLLYDQLTRSKRHQGFLKKTSDIESIANSHGWQKMHAFRHSKLHSITCISSLPFHKNLGPSKLIL